MSLTATEKWIQGFIRDTTTDPPALVMTTTLTGAKMQQGYLRDPDGRLVVKTI